MFHFGLSRSIRSGLFHIQCARRNLASLKDSFPCKHNFRCKGVFLQVYCSHSTAHKRENIMAAQMGDFIKSTKWINKTTIKLGTFNLLAPCYKTTEARYESSDCVHIDGYNRSFCFLFHSCQVLVIKMLKRWA